VFGFGCSREGDQRDCSVYAHMRYTYKNVVNAAMAAAIQEARPGDSSSS
jgi:hypothetical protein